MTDPDSAELANQLFLTAVSLIDGDVEGSASVGDLELRQDGEAWDVHKREDNMLVLVDAVRPEAFGSARLLAGYLARLHQLEASAVDLPSEPVGAFGI